jgi:uncharacterized protein involved in type VI secretion and phage assembly
MKNMQTRYFGKYRGTITNNVDPERRARVQAIVPDVLGTQPTTWAMPAAPYAGPGAGFIALPPVGAGVWIEFEQGDPDFPIWTGGWWGTAAELPAAAPPPGANQIILATPGGARITLSDAAIVIDNGHGASITLSGNTVHITGVMV